MTKYEMYTILLEEVEVSQEALDLIIKINGDKEQTYKDVLFAVTDKYKTFEQLENDGMCNEDEFKEIN